MNNCSHVGNVGGIKAPAWIGPNAYLGKLLNDVWKVVVYSINNYIHNNKYYVSKKLQLQGFVTRF